VIKAFDPLADANLSPDQRKVWEETRANLDLTRTQVRELEKRIRELEHRTDDNPTMILTRPEFNREVARMLAFDERYGGTSSIVYFDFENMEEISGRYGKSVANAAIREITNIFTEQVRGSDIIGRLAPDEFGILLVRCSNADAWKKGKHLAGVLMQKINEMHGNKLDLQIGYGAYTFREDEDVSKGLKEASQLLTKTITQ